MEVALIVELVRLCVVCLLPLIFVCLSICCLYICVFKYSASCCNICGLNEGSLIKIIMKFNKL